MEEPLEQGAPESYSMLETSSTSINQCFLTVADLVTYRGAYPYMAGMSLP